MIDESVILAAERLRDDLSEFRRELRQRHAQARQVTATEIRKQAAHLAETWLVEVAPLPNVAVVIGKDAIADLNVHFQRVLTFSEHATTRGRYDVELNAILNAFTVSVVVPLKQSRGKSLQSANIERQPRGPIPSAFIGQSFSTADERINQCVFDTLTSVGIRVVTGEVPKANSISEKVKRLIEGQPLFVGIFTRRDKISHKSEWTTSAWVIDEKAYAVGRNKRLILLKEQGVGSIGGIQGDYEYLEFSRDALETLVIRVLQLFELSNDGLSD